MKKLSILILSILFIACTQKTDNQDLLSESDTVVLKTIETKGDKDSYIEQEIKTIGDGTLSLQTWAFHKGKVVCLLVVFEGYKSYRVNSSIEYVTLITDSTKKSEWQKAEKARLAYIKKMTSYDSIRP